MAEQYLRVYLDGDVEALDEVPAGAALVHHTMHNWVGDDLYQVEFPFITSSSPIPPAPGRLFAQYRGNQYLYGFVMAAPLPPSLVIAYEMAAGAWMENIADSYVLRYKTIGPPFTDWFGSGDGPPALFLYSSDGGIATAYMKIYVESSIEGPDGPFWTSFIGSAEL